MSASIQMSKKFLVDVFKLILCLDDVGLDDGTRALCKSIETQISAKMAAMDRRKTFTEYKIAGQGAEREGKRLEYLDKAGIAEDWRTSKEIRASDI